MEPEEIEARSVRVFETLVLHATDAVYWLDGSSAATLAAMRRIDRPVAVELSERPGDMQSLSKVGQMAFWRRADATIINGIATEAQKTRPAVPPFTVEGIVREARCYYNPRAFSLILGSGEGHGVVLYPSPSGTRWPAAGGLFGTLRLAQNEAPLPWGLLELVVELPATETMTFRAQADRNGDFALALTRLPPLPESVESYPSQLSLRADLAADSETPVDLDLLGDALLGEIGVADSFLEQIDLEIHPGEVVRVNSLNRTYLAVQAP